ncbi:MAG: ThiF family adenylyltransferase [Egibacteraceae bacterium]
MTSADDVVTLMQGCDLLILCADQPHPDIQLWTNEAALRTATPWTICLYTGPMMVTGIFIPRQTPCYRCYLETEPTLLVSESGERGEALFAPAGNAVIAPSANLTGHLGALDAIYFLTGLKAQTVGRVFHQNLMIYDHHYYIEPSFSHSCPACGPHELGARAALATATSP